MAWTARTRLRIWLQEEKAKGRITEDASALLWLLAIEVDDHTLEALMDSSVAHRIGQQSLQSANAGKAHAAVEPGAERQKQEEERIPPFHAGPDCP